MDLLAIKNAMASVEENHSVLIYGPPKSGKTRLVASAALIPEIENIYWHDNENGYHTILSMDLPDWALAKIKLFRYPDTRTNPIAIETMLKVFSAKTPVTICDQHGKVNCVACRTGNTFQGTPFSLGTCTHKDLVVIDSSSQLGDSALNSACIGQDVTYKATFDDYGASGKYLADILSVIQQCHNTNFIVITHELVDEEVINGVKKDRIFPLMGTKTFSRKVAKYFGTVVYTHMKLGKHAAGSSSTYKTETLTGSRVGAVLEKSKEPCMADILVAGGIIKSSIGDSTATEQSSPPEKVVPKKPGLVLPGKK